MGRTTWYLVLGNGPTSLDGENNRRGKIAVLPLSWLTGTAWTSTSPYTDGPPQVLVENGTVRPVKAFRIPNEAPTGGAWPSTYAAADVSNQGGVFMLDPKEVQERDADGIPMDDTNGDPITVEISESYVSDLISIDLNLETPVNPIFGGMYETEAVYFGTTDGSEFVGAEDATLWPYGGRAYRLVTRDNATTTTRLNPPGNWKLKKIMDTGGPITGALSLGWDKANFWIYFGTGKFFSIKDKPDDTIQHFYGLKETLDPATCEPSWGEFDWGATLDPGGTSGSKGFVRSDYILTADIEGVTLTDPVDGSTVPLIFCEDGSSSSGDCPLGSLGSTVPALDTDGTVLDGLMEVDDQGNPTLARQFYSFEDLRKYIAGDGRDYNFLNNDPPGIGTLRFPGTNLAHPIVRHDNVTEF